MSLKPQDKLLAQKLILGQNKIRIVDALTDFNNDKADLADVNRGMLSNEVGR